MRKLILFAFIVTLLLWGCTSSNGTGNFKLYLTDQPIDIDNAEEILVTISEINIQKVEEGFSTVWAGTHTYDLLKLRSQEEKILDITLGEGMYTQIRLVIASGQIVIDGETYDMTVPSSEVKIPVVFNIMDGDLVEIVLDFEAEHSIQVVNAGQSEEYILRPVIRVKSIGY